MRFVVLILAVVTTLFLTGCASLTQTPGEGRISLKRNMKRDTKLMGEDWNRFWLIDRPSRSSKYHM